MRYAISETSSSRRMKCIHGQMYSTYGKIENDGVIQQLILEEVMRHRNSGIAKKVKSLFETL